MLRKNNNNNNNKNNKSSYNFQKKNKTKKNIINASLNICHSLFLEVDDDISLKIAFTTKLNETWIVLFFFFEQGMH